MIFDTIDLRNMPYFFPVLSPSFSFNSLECVDISEITKALDIAPTYTWEQQIPNLVGAKGVPQRTWTFQFFPMSDLFIEPAISLILKKFHPLYRTINRLLDKFPIEVTIYIREYVINHSVNSFEFEGYFPIMEISRPMMRQICEVEASLQFDVFSIDAFETLENINIVSHYIERDDYIEGNDKSYWVLDADNCKYC